MVDRPANEHLLDLPKGGVLAFAEEGDRASADVVIFFHGVFTVGAISHVAPALAQRRIHYIAPTLPGWGESSAVPKHTPYPTYIYEAITHLVTFLHPDTTNLRLYIGGASFGSILAQMLYGAPYDRFPLGRHIAGMLLIVPYSPPHMHLEAANSLSLPNYFMLSSIGRLPFRIVPKFGRLIMKRHVESRENAAHFIQRFGFQHMDPGERVAYDRWMVARGLQPGEELRELGDLMYRSVRVSWEGFLSIPEIYRSDWGGYSPQFLDQEHSDKPVLIVLMTADPETNKMGEWLAQALKNTRVRVEDGGHMGALFVMDEIWADFLSLAQSNRPVGGS